MRKLKLQVQQTIDGFVAGPQGQLDWMTNVMEKNLEKFVNELTDSVDTIIMGRKMSREFLDYWEGVVHNKPGDPEFEFAKKMVDKPKIIFSKTVSSIKGENVSVENGDMVEAVKKLKTQPGKDIIVYGGATFVSALIENDLIDDYYLCLNPVALGEGMRIFNAKKPMELVASTAFAESTVVNHFRPKKA